MGGFYGHIELSTLTCQLHYKASPYGERIDLDIDLYSSVSADGYIYNLKDLRSKLATSGDIETIRTLFQSDPTSFPAGLSGEFTTVVQSRDSIEISTNHSCSRRVFYALQREKLYFHFNLKSLQETLEKDGIKSSPNPVALRSLLSIGGVYGNQTVIQEIFILRAGEKLVITTNGIELERYYLPNSSETKLHKTDFLDEIHSRFLTAVEQQYSHDDIIDFQLLSGGLDSRMNLSLAAEKGIKQEAVLCFGQTGYRDHWISEQIAEKYNLKHDFVPLENGDYLKSIDENILAVDGLCFYASSAHFNYALEKTKYISPIIHTGQVGRTIFTEHPFGVWQNLSEYKALLCSNKFADSISSEVKSEMELYEDMDIFYLNNRLYRVISSGNYVAQKVGYIVSPFSDPSVQDLAYTMPRSWKQDGQIQWEYLWKYHKDVMAFSQEEFGRPVRSHMERFVGRVQNKLRNIYYKKIHPSPQKLSMNPLEQWWDENQSLRESLDNYFNSNIQLIEDDPELTIFCKQLYDSNIILEKTLALTVVGVMKNYFGK